MRSIIFLRSQENTMGFMYVFWFLFCVYFFISFVKGATDCVYSSALLSYTFGPDTNVIPLFPPFVIMNEVQASKNITVNRYSSSDEVGTHIDAPARFNIDGFRTGEIPFCDLFLVPAIQIDLADKVAKDRNYEATVEDIEQWICDNGPLPERAVVIFNFGWSYKYDNPQRYFMNESSPPLQFSWPGVSLEAAEFLVQCGNDILAVGVDSPGLSGGEASSSPVPGTPPPTPANRYLTRYGLYIIENLQLRSIGLPNRGFFLTVGILNFQKETAVPAYVLAEFCADTKPELVCPAPTLQTVLKGFYPSPRRRASKNQPLPLVPYSKNKNPNFNRKGRGYRRV